MLDLKESPAKSKPPYGMDGANIAPYFSPGDACEHRLDIADGSTPDVDPGSRLDCAVATRSTGLVHTVPHDDRDVKVVWAFPTS